MMVLSCRSILSYFCTTIRHATLLAITGAILAVLYISSQIATTTFEYMEKTLFMPCIIGICARG